jgi:trimethylamine--corrinoid protein Co-methyltransferase
LKSLHEVEPGGHHLGTEHTIRHFETAFFKSKLFDYNDAEKWLIEGKKSADQVAAEKVKELLSEYEVPDIDPSIQEALDEFVSKRKAEINASAKPTD